MFIITLNKVRVGIIIPNHTSWLVILFTFTTTVVQLMAKFIHLCAAHMCSLEQLSKANM